MTQPVKSVLWLLASVLLARLALSALIPFMDTTEPRYAEIARIMAQSNDWITPWFNNGVPFWGKPPLSFWAQALSFKLFGVNEFAGRLPSWLANLGIVGLIYALGMAIPSNQQHEKNRVRLNALWAALIYATTALGFLSAGTVMTDSFLTLGTTLTLASLILRLRGNSEYWGWGFFAGLAIGLLAKGPLALVLTGVPVFLWVLITRQWHTLWQCLPWLRGTLAMLILVVPWYVLAEIKTPGFLDYFIVGEHIKRFLISHWAGDLYGNAHQFTRGTIWLYLLLASFPWGFVLIAAVLRKYTRTRSGGDAPKIPNGLTLLITASALTPAVFFTFSGNILWTYVLPGLPFLALLAARACPLPDSHVLRRTALASALLVPALGASAAAWVTAHPDSLKTEKYLIGRFESRSGAPARQITYLNSVPFSARFYSAGTVNTASWASVKPLLSALAPSQHRYFAVEKGSPQVHSLLEYQAQPMDQDRRYTLYRVSGTTRHANEAGADKSSPDA
jgi:4-amino-4-deoxy-L-arabinose transferase-like glycosyltransferase